MFGVNTELLLLASGRYHRFCQIASQSHLHDTENWHFQKKATEPNYELVFASIQIIRFLDKTGEKTED